MTTLVRPALSLMLLMTLITGAVYPLVVTGVAQVVFPEQANGSLLRDDQGQVRGSLQIAQAFQGDAWFQSRPSAADYATVASGASNLAPSNPALATRVSEAAASVFTAQQGPVPLALLTTSGSGLDPHLPPAAVAYQVPKVAAARQVSVQALRGLVEQFTLQPLVGPPVVNILALNMALDRLAPASK